MAVLIPRLRTLGVRLSEDEYLSLEKFCVESGARSISDLARTAIAAFLMHAHQEHGLASIVNQHAVQVKDLEQRIERLTSEIALLKANAGERDGDQDAEAADDGSSEAESLPEPPRPAPDV